MAITKITIPRKSWTSGTGRTALLVSHDGRRVKIVPADWDAMTRKMFPQGSPNWSLRSAIFKKLGLEMSAGGTMFVPKAYTDKTGRSTFRGLTFKQISALQRKY